MFSLQGCALPATFSIIDIENVLVIGIDKQGDNVVLTCIVDKLSGAQQSSGTSNKTKLYITEGKTIAEAKRKLHEIADKRISLFHLRYVLIGQSIAEEGTLQYLNYFFELDEANYFIQPFVAKQRSAKEYIELVNNKENNFFQCLSTLTKEADRTALSKKCTLLDFAIMQECDWQDVYIPSLEIILPDVKDDNLNDIKPEENFKMKLNSYAIFDNDKLAMYLSDDLALGFTLMLGGVKSCVLTVKDSKDQLVSVESIESKTKIKADYGESLTATINVDIRCNMFDYQINNSISKKDYLKDIEQKLNELLQKNIIDALTLLQAQKTDVVGIGDVFYHKNPKKWEEVKGNWKDTFSNLKISVKVSTCIRGNYNIVEPIEN